MANRFGRTMVLALGLGVLLVLYWVLQVEREGGRESASSPSSEEAEEEMAPALDSTPRESQLESRAVPSSTSSMRAEATDRPDGPVMRVLVRDAVNGKPIAGALVTLFDRATPVPGRTDRDGVCALPLLAPREPALLSVEAAGYFHSSQEAVPSNLVVVRLARAAILSGRVLAADTGEPVAGATIELLHDACAACEPERSASASDGDYELSAVPLWRGAVLEVRAEGFAPTRRTFELRRDEPRIVQDIQLVRGLRLAGRVEDWSNGSGVSGARVGELLAGEDGRFQGLVLPQPASTRTNLEIRAPGYAALRVAIDLAPGKELVFRLPRLAVLQGQVIDSIGQPLEGVLVSFEAGGPARLADGTSAETSLLYELPEGWSYSSDEPAEKSDREGRYRTTVLPWSLNGKARAHRRGFETGETALRSIGEPGSVHRLDWWLEPRQVPTAVRGSVLLDGQVIPGLEGTLSWRGATRSGTVRFKETFYSFVEPGDLQLSVVLDALTQHPPSDLSVHVEKGEERIVQVDVTASRNTITGSVRFENGSPVAGTTVQASCPLSREDPRCRVLHRAVTDESGEYELFVTDIGSSFRVSTPNLAGVELVEEEVVPGASGVDFVLDPFYRLFLRARDARTGAALGLGEAVQLFARGVLRGDAAAGGFWGLEPVSERTDAGGWYEFWLTSPEADLLAWPGAEELTPYGTSLLSRAKLDGGEPARIELLLERGFDVALELPGAHASWPGDHELLLIEEELWGSVWGGDQLWESPIDGLPERRSVRFDAEGRALVRGLAPGSYRFKVQPPDLLLDPELVRVDRGVLSVPVRWSRKE